jgi:hypothetical protein
MTSAKVRSLQVRPIQSADLSFDAAGVLGKQNLNKARLGSRITGYDLSTTLIPNLGRTVSNGTDETLYYNVENLHSALNDHYLFALRNDLMEASLRQSITQRDLLFLQRFKHIDAIVNTMRDVFSDRFRKIEELRDLSTQHKDALKASYENSNWDRVITDSKTLTRHTGDVNTETQLTPIAMKNTAHKVQVDASPPSTHNVESSQVIPQVWENRAWKDLEKEGTNFQSQKSTSINDLTQVSTTRNVEYRHPHLENLLQYQRKQLDLQEEWLSNKNISNTMPDLERILNKELEVIDLEIRKAQVKLTQSYLISPIPGIVTAIYKDLGEMVQPGEPVLRVENDEKVLLVGFIQYRGILRIGNGGDPERRDVNITTSSIYEGDEPLSIPGRLVSVRGHDVDDDEWDIIIECDNSHRALPINYHFDRETTRIEIIDEAQLIA